MKIVSFQMIIDRVLEKGGAVLQVTTMTGSCGKLAKGDIAYVKAVSPTGKIAEAIATRVFDTNPEIDCYYDGVLANTYLLRK